ncbi:MAG: NAD(P)H-dependent oxidoreductase, partial [Shimia sp.]
MTGKRIFVLNGHPAAESLTGSVAQSYADAARKSGHDVRVVNLH